MREELLELDQKCTVEEEARVKETLQQKNQPSRKLRGVVEAFVALSSLKGLNQWTTTPEGFR